MYQLFKFLTIGAGIFFLGCNNQPSSTPVEIPIKNIQKTVSKIKTNWNKEINETYSNEIENKNTLVNKLGASLFLSYQDYFLRKQNHQSLVFKGFGVRDYIYKLVSNQNKYILDNKARKIGYKSLVDMYDIYLDFFVNLDSIEFINWLQAQNIDINQLMNPITLETETNSIINTIYTPYLRYEGIFKPIILKEWGVKKNGNFISFTKKDYIPYALIVKAIKLKLQQVK